MSDQTPASTDPTTPAVGTSPFASGPRWAVIGIFILLAFQAITYARAFLMPVVLALLLTLVFGPLRRLLGRAGVSAGVAAMIIVGTLVAALLAGILTLATPASQWVENAPEIGRLLETKMRELRDAAEGMREAAEQVDQIAAGGEPEAGQDVQRVVIDESGYVADFALTAPAVLAQALFTLILLFFLLASGDMFYEKVVHALPTFSDKRRAIRIAHDIERKLSRYLSTIAAINACLGLSIGLAMWALGMPNPVLFGVIGFFFNFIPYLGAIIGVMIAVAVGVVSFEQTEQAFIAGAAYFALTAVEGQFVTPYFVGRSLQLNTVVVFVSVTLWAWLWSVVGMLVATPLLVTIRTLCEHIPALQNFGDFLSARGAERANETGEEPVD